jgi:hypothetical protein
MNININVKRKFKINGKEYNSLEEMPDDIREVLKKALDSRAGSGHWINSEMTRSRIIFNGTEYDSLAAMPQDVRQLYEKVLRAAESGGASSGVDIAKMSGGVLTKPDTIGNGRPGNIGKPTKAESSFSPRILMVSAALMGLIFLLYYLFQNR